MPLTSSGHGLERLTSSSVALVAQSQSHLVHAALGLQLRLRRHQRAHHARNAAAAANDAAAGACGSSGGSGERLDKRGRGGGAAEAYMHPARRLRAAPPHAPGVSVLQRVFVVLLQCVIARYNA